MKIKPRNDILLVEKISDLGKNNPELPTSILLPDSTNSSNFIKAKVLEVGPDVTDIEAGDIVLANDLIEPIENKNKKIGFILQKNIHAIILNDDYHGPN